MSRMPKMNLWIDAFNSDTSFLSDEELGVYFRLIFFAWGREGYLPNNIDFIVSLTRNANRDIVEKILNLYWTIDGDKYYQKRLREEYLRAVEVTEKAKKSAEARWGVQKETSSSPSVLKLEHHTEGMQTHSEGSASKSISKSISISNNIIDKHFDKFWDGVCYKISKGQARRNYRKLHQDWWEEPQMLSKKYNQYYNDLKDKQFAKHPSTWLSAEGFLDESVNQKEMSDSEMQEWKFKGDIEMRKKGIKPLSWSVQYIRKLDEAIAKNGS